MVMRVMMVVVTMMITMVMMMMMIDCFNVCIEILYRTSDVMES